MAAGVASAPAGRARVETSGAPGCVGNRRRSRPEHDDLRRDRGARRQQPALNRCVAHWSGGLRRSWTPA